MIAIALLAMQSSMQAPATPAGPCPPEHAAMGHCKPGAAAAEPVEAPAPPCPPHHAAMGHCKADAAPSPSVPEASVPDAPAPPAPRVDAADAIFGADAMAASRKQLYAEHGGGAFSQIMIDRAEWRTRDGRDGYAWDAEGWFGGDIDRLTVKTEGEGDRGGPFEGGEVQALWSHAIGPYFNAQTGIRQDFGPGPSPTYAVFGIEGLAPYWFEVEGALFLSDEGDASARAEASYDQRITQRLILQPRVEANVAFQATPELDTGSGFTSIEAGLRLRYEVAREFAPYIGVTWERKLDGTARRARAAGDDASRPAFVAGLRVWF